MYKKIPLYVVIIIFLLTAMLTFQITYVLTYKNYSEKISEKVEEKESENQAFIEKLENKMEEVDNCIRLNYYGEIDDDEAIKWAVTGYIAGIGDKWGQYMDPEEYADMIKSEQGESEGIGVIVIYNSETGLAEITRIIPNSPSDNSGLEIGDMIYSVNGESAAELGYYETISKVRGEIGTKVDITVLRGEETVDFSILRDKYTVESVEYHMYSDGKTGIIRILEFNDTTFEQFKEAVSELKAQGANALVFDVRDNPGGSLKSVTAVLDYLLPEGPIIRIVSKGGKEESIASDENELDMPMVVIANGSTASAAELFSSALRDYNKAKIVGTKTYGKGCMQSIFPFLDGSALRVTVSLYLPPISPGYNDIGVEPDVEIELSEEQKKISHYQRKDTEDDQLLKAIEVLYNK